MIRTYTYTCFIFYVIMCISYPSISNSPCTDCLCALAGKDDPFWKNKVGTVHGPRYASSCKAIVSTQLFSFKLGGSLPDVWYCLSQAPQSIPFRWVRFWKATENGHSDVLIEHQPDGRKCLLSTAQLMKTYASGNHLTIKRLYTINK